MHKHIARFSTFMSQTLHCASDIEQSLEHIHQILTNLAETEQALPLSDLENKNEQSADSLLLKPQNGSLNTLGANNARFAFYAWADEKMFNAPRQDASAWAALSLQGKYFQTFEAGHLFYVRLEEELDALGIVRTEDISPLSLPARMERAVHSLHGKNVPSGLAAFAQCLLYGFCGQYFNNQDILLELRKHAHALLQDREEPVQMSTTKTQSMTLSLESFLLFVLPLLITVGFGVFCAAVLADLPIDIY